MTEGIVENTKVDPPSVDNNGETLSEDDTEKSEAMPVVGPVLLDTRTEHTTLNPMRDGEVLVHDRLDAVVGLPYTTNDGAPSRIGRLLLVV